MLEKILEEGAGELGIAVSREEASQFLIYLEELISWNRKINLTSITDGREIIVKHFLDSILPLSVFPIKEQLVLDIGAGAGFPGIPIKILRPAITLTLIESVKKKVKFLERIIKVLDLKNSVALCGRAEDLASENRGKYDIVLSRAVAPLNILLEYSLPFVRVGGVALALKGPGVHDEITSSENALSVLGGAIEDVKKVKLPLMDAVRTVVIVKKHSETPAKYPRRAGTAKKKPL